MKTSHIALIPLALITLVPKAGDAIPAQFGVVYFLPETPAESLQQLQRIKADGFNMIKIASWVWTVPEEGTPLRKVVDATLRWCDHNDMYVWLLHNIQYGSPGQGGDIEKALTQPAAQARKSLEPWAHALAGHPSVVGVLLGNEVSPGGLSRFEDHPKYVAAFRNWLRERHNNIAALNRRWRTDFDSFSDVQPPSSDDPGAIDAHRFIRSTFAQFYNAIAARVLRPILGDKLYGSKGGCSPYVLRQMPEYGVAGWDDLLANWPLWRTKLIVDTTGLPAFNAELHLYHDSYGYGGSGQLSRYRYFTSGILGEWMTASFAWGSWSRPETRRIHEATPQILSDLQRLEPILRRFNHVQPKFAVLVTEANEEGIEGHPPLERAYARAATTGLPWRFITDFQLPDLEAQTLVICSNWLTRTAATTLAELSETKTLVFIGNVPRCDEYGLPLPKPTIDNLREHGTILGDWTTLREAVNCPQLPAAYRNVVDVQYLWWSKEKGHYHFPVRYPQLEARQAPGDGCTYLAVINHTRDAVEQKLPFVGTEQIATDLLNGAAVGPELVTFEPLDVRVFRVHGEDR